MKIQLENVDLQSNSGPNSFAKKLVKHMSALGCEFKLDKDYDIRLAFIENNKQDSLNIPMVQRLDGIYFNTDFDYRKQNENIKKTFLQSDGVIYQTEFNKNLTQKYFGKHKKSIVIPNGSEIELISQVAPMHEPLLESYKNIWCCASDWRPHKRLEENIKYFLEHSSENECLVVAGKTLNFQKNYERVYYTGNLDKLQLISLYKASKYFVHLSWLDHCPNVVVDARASGCQVICSSSGGTKEIAGPNAIVIQEEEWDFKPTQLYKPPKLDFTKVVKNDYNSVYDMKKVSERYMKYLEEILQKHRESK